MGKNSNSPLFIVGSPRSGTSLLRVMLNRHQDLAICDETYFFYYCYSRRRAFGDISDPMKRKLLAERYLELNRIRRLGFDQKKLMGYLMEFGVSYSNFFRALLEFYARKERKPRWGEKTPQHAYFSETICTWYKNCCLIHIVRDPRDVVASLLRMPWGSNSILQNTYEWMKCVHSAEKIKQLPNFLRVHYEDLVKNPEDEILKISNFAGLGDDIEKMLNLHQPSHENSVPDEWWFQRATKPLQKSRIGKWKDELAPEQIAMIEWVAHDKMIELGYYPSDHSLSASGRLKAKVELMKSITGQHLHNPRRLWYYWFQTKQLVREEAAIDKLQKNLISKSVEIKSKKTFDDQ